MYNGPVKVYVTGPGGATHPQFPVLVAKGRALLGTLDNRARITSGSVTMASSWVDDQGNSVKALWSPYVRKLLLSVVEAEAGEEATPEEMADQIEVETWTEVYREFGDTYVSGGTTYDRFSRLTYQTPAGEIVRFLLEERNDAGAPSTPGGPTPDYEWTERFADRQEVTDETGLETVARVVFTVPTGGFRWPEAVAAFTYRTEQDLPAPPLDAIDWREGGREEVLLLVGDTIQLRRVVSVTFQRVLYYQGSQILRQLKLVYQEGTEDYEWPAGVAVLEDPYEGDS